MQWQRCADLPVGTYNAQAVILGDKVYVGGGTLKFPPSHLHTSTCMTPQRTCGSYLRVHVTMVHLQYTTIN